MAVSPFTAAQVAAINTAESFVMPHPAVTTTAQAKANAQALFNAIMDSEPGHKRGLHLDGISAAGLLSIGALLQKTINAIP